MQKPCGIQVATEPAKIAPHRREYLLTANGDLTLAVIRAAERIFEMQLNGTVERSFCEHRAEDRKANHALSEWNPVWGPAFTRVSSPEEVLEGHATNVSPGEAKTVYPTAETAFNRCVPDIIINGNRFRIQAIEYLKNVPNWSADEADTGMRMVDGANLIAGVQKSQSSRTLPKTFELTAERLVGFVFESTPTVVANAESVQSLQDVFREGAAGINNVGGHHRYFEPVLPNERNKRRKLLGNLGGFYVSAGPDCYIDSIEAQPGGGLRQFRAFQKLQVL